MKKADIQEFFHILKETDPEPGGELDFRNSFTLLIAVVLSAQSTDKGVNKVTPALFDAADNPKDMVKLGEDNIREKIKTLGLYNSKAKNVYKLSKKIVDDYDCIIPEDRNELVKLPGVGRKTANVVLNIAFGHDTIAVDTHVFRVSNRTGLATGKNVDEVENKLEKIIPQKYKRHAHHWLILHGRYICKARNPNCAVCPVAHICEYLHKTA